MTFKATSYGVICKISNKILCIQRQNSIACVDILMGNFKTYKSLRELAYNLTPEELFILQTQGISTLQVTFQAKIPKRIRNSFVIISNILKNINHQELCFEKTEILLPKGRPKKNENNVLAAKREFFEETGCFIPFLNYKFKSTEKYFGPENIILYENVYFHGKLNKFNPNFHCREVSKVYLYSYKEFYDKIDPRRIELKYLIFNLNKNNF